MVRELVLVPYCVRDLSCEAESREDEMTCLRDKCAQYAPGKCAIYSLLTEAEKSGRKIKIVVSARVLHKMLQEENPEIVLGMACRNKVRITSSALQQRGINSRHICLANDSCFKETHVPSQFSMQEYLALLA